MSGLNPFRRSLSGAMANKQAPQPISDDDDKQLPDAPVTASEAGSHTQTSLFPDDMPSFPGLGHSQTAPPTHIKRLSGSGNPTLMPRLFRSGTESESPLPSPTLQEPRNPFASPSPLSGYDSDNIRFHRPTMEVVPNASDYWRDSAGTTGEASAANRMSYSPASSGRIKRGTLDVDAFKRLLLTGDAGFEDFLEAQTPSDTETQAASKGGDSANAEFSKQVPPETSFNLQQQDSSYGPSKSNAGEEQASKEPSESPAKRKKPPPPKTRHGKLIQSESGAQPSDPFTESPQPATHPQSPPGSGGRSFSDTPRVTRSSTRSATAQDRRAGSKSEPFPPPKPSPKRPPTPPARRNSQRTAANIGKRTLRSSGSLAGVSMSSIVDSTSQQAPPPPPPPSRRRDRESESDVSGQSNNLNSTSNSTNQPDTNLGSASRSGDAPARLSRAPSTTNVPPQPPPRRRGGGSQVRDVDEDGSANPAPTVFQELEQRAEETGEPFMQPSSASRVLNDLSKLQQELLDFQEECERQTS